MRQRLFASAALFVTGCSLFTSLDGLSADADEPLDDGGTDGRNVDSGGGGEDGAADGAATDGGARLCSTVDAAICDDFDDPSDTTFAKWTVKVDEPGGTVTRADAGFSAPNAASCRAISTGDQISAFLEKTFDPVKRSRFFYRFRIDETESNGTLTFGQMNLDAPGNARTSVRLTLGGGFAKFEGAVYPTLSGQGTFPDLTSKFAVSANAWHAVDMTIDWQATPARATIDFDSMRVADGTPITGSTFGPGKLAVAAGIYYLQGGDGPWRMSLDDVALQIE